MRKLPRKVFCAGIFLQYFLHPFSTLIIYKTVLANERIRKVENMFARTRDEQKWLSSPQNISSCQVFYFTLV